MRRIENIFYKIALVMVICILVMIAIAGLFWQAGYDYADFPYFERTAIKHVCAVLGIIVLLILYMYMGKKFHWNLYLLTVLYVGVSLAYLFFVQLEPFSDMKMIYDSAAHNMRDETGYLSWSGTQIPSALYLWVVLKIFGNNIFVPKILNITFNIVTYFFIYKIYKLFSDDTDDVKAIIWFSAIFIPPGLYENHIYNDVLFTMLILIMFYLVMKKKYTKWMLVLLCGIGIVQCLFRLSGVVFVIAVAMYMILFQREWKKAILCSVIIFAGIIGAGRVNKVIFQADVSKEVPVWSYIQMGINEEEFGFQDGTHSTDWTWQDCVEKYKSMGWKKVTKVLAKKTVWMWTEGTYQAQRYAFGDATAVYTKENLLTHELRNLDGTIRNSLNLIIKGQYYIYMLLALLGVLKLKSKREYSLLLYAVCGIACFYLIWEMKSRYIYSLYPVFMIFAYFGWREVIRKIKNRINNKEKSGTE